ncbi:hypothetical protein [Pectobacterium brasiliense]|uniref:hypothetical protein n=1 Tax=Pectobacterium brasiliense TaxID=180957 RepID=UPI001968B7D9|nr:hypothetical protein [Pectobacterium brasiliense]MBN3262939.1 hypothetical protein [Pectobacterium brasiliense]
MKSTKNPHDDSQEYADELKKHVVKLVKEEQARVEKQQQLGRIYALLAEKIKAAFENANLGKILSLTVSDKTYPLKVHSAAANNFGTEVTIKVATIESNGIALSIAPDEITSEDADHWFQFVVRGNRKIHERENGTFAVEVSQVHSSLGEMYFLIYENDKDWELTIQPVSIQQQEQEQEPLTEAGILRIIYGIFKPDFNL